MYNEVGSHQRSRFLIISSQLFSHAVFFFFIVETQHEQILCVRFRNQTFFLFAFFYELNHFTESKYARYTAWYQELFVLQLNGSTAHSKPAASSVPGASTATLISNSRLQTASTCPNRCADIPFLSSLSSPTLRLIINNTDKWGDRLHSQWRKQIAVMLQLWDSVMAAWQLFLSSFILFFFYPTNNNVHQKKPIK